MSSLESSIEKSLIEQLTKGISQWTYRPDIKDSEALWENFRQKLNQNNIGLLQGKEITDGEMEWIKTYMNEQSASSFKAALWLAGEHGIARIPLPREDASLGQVNLLAIDSHEVAGGHSSYEVINQYVPSTGDRERRFDVSLLINGIPMIHIELKNSGHPFMDAFRQIQNYCRENQFRGLFGFVQMFVVSNESETRYIAANISGDMGEKFLTRWVDTENKPVDGYIEFAQAALNIPMAHLMVGKYSVIDEAKRRQILLRPYQIHAISKVREASKNSKSGYVWHTTGSGKTLTSYTVTKNLLDIPSVDKTIFLIDRRDLDKQTSDDFSSYAHNDNIVIDKTNNSYELEKKLLSTERTAIVTTIQKMQSIIRKYSAVNLTKEELNRKEKIRAKRLAFVVDECHRTVSPKTHNELKHFFGSTARPCLWYGFTGTPIFGENKRQACGDLPRTTKELYGDELHRYSIKEAIHDGAVLGFQIQSLGKGKETCQDIALQCNLFDEETLADMSAYDVEKAVIKHYEKSKQPFFETDEHRLEVIDYIVNKSAAKFNLNAGEGNTFEGLLTCNSIKDAQRYYELFKQFIKEGKVHENIRSKLPDFPKIAITYSIGENEDGVAADKEKMKKALADYKEMFPEAPAAIDDLSAYNADLNKRLARKESRYKVRTEQLDLVIVVDRLLTGFDAPCLSTIFLDRPPMQPQHLIQAFSRTNRIFTPVKRYGQVVTMQYPASYTKKIDEALILYSHGGTKEVSAPTWEETQVELKEAIKQFKLVSEKIDLKDSSIDTGKLKEFVKAYQKVDRLYGNAQVYDEFLENGGEAGFGISLKELQAYGGSYQNAIEKLKNVIIEDDPETEKELQFVDLDYTLESVKLTKVNYRYLVTLIQAHVPETEKTLSIRKEDEEKVLKYLRLYKQTNPRIGEVLEQIWFELQMNPQLFIGKDVLVLAQERIQQIIDKELRKFSEEWKVSLEELTAFKNTSYLVGKSDLNGNYEEFRKQKSISKLIYKKELRKAVTSFFKDIIGPLQTL